MRYELPSLHVADGEQILVRLRFVDADRYATFEDVDNDLPVESRVPMIIGSLQVLRATLSAMSRQYSRIEMDLPKLVMEVEYRGCEGHSPFEGTRRETLTVPTTVDD